MEGVELELRQSGPQAHSSILVAKLPVTTACYTVQEVQVKNKAGDGWAGRAYWIGVLNTSSDKQSLLPGL